MLSWIGRGHLVLTPTKKKTHRAIGCVCVCVDKFVDGEQEMDKDEWTKMTPDSLIFNNIGNLKFYWREWGVEENSDSLKQLLRRLGEGISPNQVLSVY